MKIWISKLIFGNRKTRNFPKPFLTFSVQIKGMIWCYSNRGDEASMCHFKEIDFWLNNILFVA